MLMDQESGPHGVPAHLRQSSSTPACTACALYEVPSTYDVVCHSTYGVHTHVPPHITTQAENTEHEHGLNIVETYAIHTIYEEVLCILNSKYCTG